MLPHDEKESNAFKAYQPSFLSSSTNQHYKSALQISITNQHYKSALQISIKIIIK
jgi:hypothetical protein